MDQLLQDYLILLVYADIAVYTVIGAELTEGVETGSVLPDLPHLEPPLLLLPHAFTGRQRLLGGQADEGRQRASLLAH